MKSLNKFLQLSWLERWLFVQALLLLPLTVMALRIVGFARWQAVLARFAPLCELLTPDSDKLDELPTSDAGSVIHRIRRTAWIMRAARRRVPLNVTCLPQSLTLWWLLRRQGIASALRIGVRKEGGLLEAHAWVECGGIIVNGGSDAHRRFAAFESAIAPREVISL
ncbi:MAG: lasso peptide biosynthesis B2 protein [Acidobacteriota bacterium]|nr:lasso peptide biosynthesis B2 protein [Blastocatellia bacterium]MDW8239329.1 lasso peptide biosynthesis B2 protein [Acidobacteriota bacterium]